MKQKIKKLIWDHVCLNHDEMKAKITEFPIISFDMFDTLVTRNVMEPVEIYTYVERIYQLNFGSLPFDYKKLRIGAERKARQKIHREVTLAEIYDELEDLTGQKCDTFMQAEKQCELHFIEARKDMEDIYKECICQGKKIYILSDMYLDKETITKILHKCGYSNWTGLYVSSESGATKRNGELYKLFLDQENLLPGNVLHIGDSIKSDYLKSRQYCLKSLLIENKRWIPFFDRKNPVGLNEQEWLDYTTLQTFCNNQLKGEKEYSYILGYTVLGPILFAFSEWLNEIVLKEKPNCLAFMAREGKILKKAYEQMYPQEPIPVIYLRTSRRSVAYPELLEAKTISDILDILPVKRNEDLTGVLELLGLNNEKVSKQIKDLGYTMQTPIKNVSGNVFEILKDAMREKALQQKEYLKKYLEQKGIWGTVLTADIGWRGTALHYLNKFCDNHVPEKNICIKGCYLGVLTDNKMSYFSKDQKSGYWFDEKHDEEWGYVVAISRMACELLFMTNEGSTTHYIEKNGKVIPKMDPLEFSDSDSCKIQIVQNAALDFIDAFRDSAIKEMVNITPKITLANYFKFGIRPNKESLSFINTFHYTEAGAVYAYKAKRFWKYLFRPNKWIKDFSNTAWKTGFMRQCFYLDLPYYKILVWLRRIDQHRTLQKN